MDDEKDNDHGSGYRAMRMVRMVFLMLFCAGFGNVPRVGDMRTIAEERFESTIIGAFCGLGIELFIRLCGKK